MCYLNEHRDNYSEESKSLWQFKRDETSADNAYLSVVNNSLNSQSFKYKAAFVGKRKDLFDDTNSSVNTQK